ncbi:hypothetical protein [Nocardia asteroides]|uniref:hypothetical protein n=1 Tax=Nocardia asteroides TaxID=1824 RepID=UPI001E5D76E3|nr:hypothetical protein [Nocardia asteroides]UGT63648.1 hypothetical protein LTT61_10185 [Nocardia asteroides]
MRSSRPDPALRTPPEPAREWRETRLRLRWVALRAWGALLGTLALGPATGVLLYLESTATSPGLQRLAATGSTFTGAAFVLWTLVLALPLFLRYRRRRRALRNPWQQFWFEHVPENGRDWVILIDLDGRIAGTLVLRSRGNTAAALLDATSDAIWFAGNPARFGILSRPGGLDLHDARRPRLRKPPAPTFHTPPDTRFDPPTAVFTMIRDGDRVVMRAADGTPTHHPR